MHFPVSILLVDENEPRRQFLATALGALDHTVTAASKTQTCIQELDVAGHDVLILDLSLSDADPAGLIARAFRLNPDLTVIVLACQQSSDRIAASIQAGAKHCFVHPVNDAALAHAIAAAHPGPSRARAPMVAPADTRPIDGFDGTSTPMRSVYAGIRAAARSRATVFITGESGTGKRLCAQAIHTRSSQSPMPFLTVDCRGLGEKGLESAIEEQLRARARNGGTLFLDDVTALTPGAQLTLTRILNRIEARTQGPELRLICTAVQPPPRAARTAPLHMDLLHRLQVLPITMPPLRERRADIGALCDAGLRQFGADTNKTPPSISDCALGCLEAHSWPGNVRQLLNVLLAMTMLHDSPILTTEMLPEEVRFPHKPSLFNTAEGLAGLAGQPMSLIERAVLEDAIARHGGSVPRAARELELAPSTIYRKMTSWRSSA